MLEIAVFLAVIVLVLAGFWIVELIQKGALDKTKMQEVDAQNESAVEHVVHAAEADIEAVINKVKG